MLIGNQAVRYLSDFKTAQCNSEVRNLYHVVLERSLISSLSVDLCVVFSVPVYYRTVERFPVFVKIAHMV